MRTALYAGPAPHRDAGREPSILSAIVHRFAQWHAARRAERALSNLPNALLKDLGLTRGEIAGVVRTGRPEAHHHRHAA